MMITAPTYRVHVGIGATELTHVNCSTLACLRVSGNKCSWSTWLLSYHREGRDFTWSFPNQLLPQSWKHPSCDTYSTVCCHGFTRLMHGCELPGGQMCVFISAQCFGYIEGPDKCLISRGCQCQKFHKEACCHSGPIQTLPLHPPLQPMAGGAAYSKSSDRFSEPLWGMRLQVGLERVSGHCLGSSFCTRHWMKHCMSIPSFSHLYNCYGLHVCSPLPHPSKFLCWHPNPQCDRITRWGLWEVLWSWGWNSHEWDLWPYKGDPPPETSCPSTVWGHGEKSAVCNTAEKPRNRPFCFTRDRPCWYNAHLGLLISRTVRNKYLLFYKPPNLWSSVTAAQTD